MEARATAPLRRSPSPDTPNLPSQALALVGAMSDLAARLTDDIRQLDFAAFGDRYRQPRRDRSPDRRVPARAAPTTSRASSDRLDDIVFRCRLDPFEALAEEYKRRVREVKQAQFLGHFLERHPGIQHKAGVPLGGTFILVYHELPKPAAGRRARARTGPGSSASTTSARLRADVENGLRARRGQGRAAGRRPRPAPVQGRARRGPRPPARLPDRSPATCWCPGCPCRRSPSDVYLDAVAKLADGTVIADFFLPYQCCSDCAPIQYRLPPRACGSARARRAPTPTGSPRSRSRPKAPADRCRCRSTGGAFEELTGTLLLGVGDHTIVVRDATGNESSPVEITHPAAAGDRPDRDDRRRGRRHVPGRVHRGGRHSAVRRRSGHRRRTRPTRARCCRSPRC